MLMTMLERRSSRWSLRSEAGTSRSGSIVDAFTGLFIREGSVKGGDRIERVDVGKE